MMGANWEDDLMGYEPPALNPHYYCGTVHSPACPTGEHPVPDLACPWVTAGQSCPTGQHGR